MSAKLVDGKIVVSVPARMSKRDEDRVVADIVANVERKMTTSRKTDAELMARAHELNATFLAGKASFSSVRWVTNQKQRWGSCTQLTGEIRISHLLTDVPDYVLDAVLIHELVHTFVDGGHTKEFWSWADRAPKAERAKGYLEAYGRFGRKE